MNTIEIINKIKEVALTQDIVKSVYDGDVYTNWNSGEIKYGSVNIGLREITNNGNSTTYTFILYYGDRLLQDESNANEVITDGTNVLQSIINVLTQTDFIDISDSITFTPFVQKFVDYLGGVYAQVEITTDSSLGYCSLDNYVYVDDKDKLIEQLIDKINEYKTKDEELSLLLQTILYKLNGENI